MSYVFKPMTEDEISTSSLIDKGIYDFEVSSSVRKKSKAGNDMAEIRVNVWDNNGCIHTITDYLVFSSIALNIKKVKHFCDATGLENEYNNGSIRENLNGLVGKAVISIRDAVKNDNGGEYPRKNVITDYIKNDKKEQNINKNTSQAPLDDDIPF